MGTQRQKSHLEFIRSRERTITSAFDQVTSTKNSSNGVSSVLLYPAQLSQFPLQSKPSQKGARKLRALFTVGSLWSASLKSPQLLPVMKEDCLFSLVEVHGGCVHVCVSV